jgi:succinate CoA transferase
MSSNSTGGFPILTADEAARIINHGDLVGFSGFSAAATPKAVPAAVARKAAEEHNKGNEFRIRVLTGANGGPTLDEILAESDALGWRCPYQSAKLTRDRINQLKVEYVDMHLSQVAQSISGGFFGEVDCAVAEATEITADGRVYLTTSIGIVPTLLQRAKKVIVEINERQHPGLRELTDVYLVPDSPHRVPLNIRSPLDRIGANHALVDPKKVVGVVTTSQFDKTTPFTPTDEVSEAIAGHVVEFLLAEKRKGNLPAQLPPIQCGVGNVGNAVLAGFELHPQFPSFSMYTELIQDSLVGLLTKEKVVGVSAASLATTTEKLRIIFENMDFFSKRIVLRPSEISNNPEVIRRLGVISLNTAIDFDIYGNVNSTHFNGTTVMNGIGGSGDYASNSRLAIFMAPSIRKDGKISCVVPMCTHVDHNEHAVHVLVTEQGVADLRGLDPKQRAMRIIENCAHPAYRDYLREYVKKSGKGHIPHDLRRAFELYLNFEDHGYMLPGKIAPAEEAKARAGGS